MHEVDVLLAEHADKRNLTYTRYADDITFSSRGYIDADSIIRVVNKALSSAKNTSIRLNREKTVLVSNQYSRRITGLIITPDKHVSMGRERKRLISSMVHHVSCGSPISIGSSNLAGLLAFASDVEPRFVEALRVKYSSDLIEQLLRAAPSFADEGHGGSRRRGNS